MLYITAVHMTTVGVKGLTALVGGFTAWLHS